MANTNMRKAIEQFPSQFAYAPVIQNAKSLKNKSRFVVLGMGGSHLAADILRAWKPGIPLTVHHDYGLPSMSESDYRETLFIASSYSGNTEEVLDGCAKALRKGFKVAVIATGGALLTLAKKHRLPYIQLPATGIQPRSALGFSFMALLALLQDRSGIREAHGLARELRTGACKKNGKELARMLANRIPVIYASERNTAVAYNWKIQLNETGKIPAFYNTVPELNHNEMIGLDVLPSTKKISERMTFLVLTDKADHPRIQRRMRVLAALYRKRGLAVLLQPIAGSTRLRAITDSLLTADWCSLTLAGRYGVEAEQVPMVEELKRRLRS